MTGSRLTRREVFPFDTPKGEALRKIFETIPIDLDQLDDVVIVNPQDGDGLVYDEDILAWTNAPVGGGGGSVESVGLALPSDVFDVTNSPVTNTGTLTGTFKEQAANAFLAGPAGGGPLFSDIPTFRLLAPEDIPQFPLSRASLNDTQFLAGVGTSTNAGFGLGPITLGTGFVWGASSLDLSTNLQGWHALDPASRVQSVNTRTGAVALTDSDVPADVLEWDTATKTAALTDRGVYVYATATGAKTYEFTTTAGAAAGEYHIRNDAASGDVTLTATGVTLKAPKGGTLVLEPGDTVTVKRVASNVFHVFGSTKAA